MEVDIGGPNISAILRDKKILFICPIFFGYQDEIKQELIDLGADVYWLADRPFKSQLIRALVTMAPKLGSILASHHYRKKIKEYKQDKYDYIFVVNGQTLSKNFLHNLKIRYPSAKRILYLWDSIGNRKNIIKNLNQFEKVLTFDKNDAIEKSLIFRPLFYSDKFSSAENYPINYDLTFIGTIHSDRYKILKNISSQISKKYKIYCYLYIQALWVYFFYKLFNPNFKGANISEFKFTALDKYSLHKIFLQSRCILDVEHPLQTGLTMRTFEVLGSQKKMLTTNHKIADYDFYHPDNICIINRNNPIIPDNFIDRPFRKIPINIMYRYSLRGWIAEIFT
jgi:hypothetical protein